MHLPVPQSFVRFQLFRTLPSVVISFVVFIVIDVVNTLVTFRPDIESQPIIIVVVVIVKLNLSNFSQIGVAVAVEGRGGCCVDIAATAVVAAKAATDQGLVRAPEVLSQERGRSLHVDEKERERNNQELTTLSSPTETRLLSWTFR